MIRPFIRPAILGLLLSLASGAAYAEPAQRPAGVVELFTSQGCNSCPPADEAFAEVASKGEVVALAYHVKYWDYLGWRDTLATKVSTERQYDYMRALGATSVYTPQVVINGDTALNGADKKTLRARLDKTRSDPLPVDVNVSTNGDSIVIETAAATSPPPKTRVVLVYFDAPRTVEIDRGENVGRKLVYWNPVTEVQIAGMWHGGVERYELPASEIARKGGCTVLLQTVSSNGGPGKILGAAVVRQPASN